MRGMLTDEPRVSLADLAAAGIRLHPADAVTIVRELVRQVVRGTVPGVPSAHVIRLLPSGHLTIEGPVAASGRAVSRAATLLDSLLPPFDAPSEFRAPGALRLVIARALGTLDVPPYESLEDFARALERFGQADAQATIRRLIESWATAAAADAPEAAQQMELARAAHEPDRRTASTALTRRDPSALTVSDVRRARRATGLPLAEVSARSRIPMPLLRQLEWGYLLNWPTGLYGRTQLVRYARAAGLDEQAVVAIVWPLVEMVEREQQLEAAARVDAKTEPVAGESVDAIEVRTVPTSPEAAPVIDDRPLEIAPVSHPGRQQRARHGTRAAAAAALLAVAAMLAVILIPGLQSDFDLSITTLPFASQFERLAGTRGDTPPAAPAAPAETEPDARSREVDVAGGILETPPAQGASDASQEVAASTGRSVKSAPAAEPAAGAPAPVARPAVDDAVDTPAEPMPAFTAEGTAMFFGSDDETGTTGLMRTGDSSDGAILRITRVVDDDARNFHARLSPDGSQIAFDSDRDGVRGVYVASADGTNVRRISGEGFGAIPSWAPDGSRLAFVRAEPGNPRVWNLWIADLASGERHRLTSNRRGQPWGASWFPDGRRLSYSQGDRLLVLDVETGQERAYPSPRKGRQVRSPAVSPDGRRVIFHVERDGAWLLDMADGSMRKVLADPTAEEYAWSPDGRRVAYHSRRSGEWGVWLMLDR